MKCPKCDGEFRTYNTRLSKRLGVITRKRVCNKCKYTTTTVEVSRETWERDNRFMEAITKAIGVYNLTSNTQIQQ